MYFRRSSFYRKLFVWFLLLDEESSSATKKIIECENQNIPRSLTAFEEDKALVLDEKNDKKETINKESIKQDLENKLN